MSAVGLAPVAVRASTEPLAADALVRTWDNANIVESYPGLTTPLTFSIARGAYASVYRQLCETVGVPRRTLEAEADVFEQMIGLLDGRVYYNLGSWHRVLAMLPGFRYNQRFMERMMGAARPAALSVGGGQRSREVAMATMRLGWLWLRFGPTARQFETSIAALLDENARLDLTNQTPEALIEVFERVRRRSIGSWRAPLLNDLFLMVVHGLLRTTGDAWLGAGADALVNALLRTGDLSSAAPAAALTRIAARVVAEPTWLHCLVSTDPVAMQAVVDSDPRLADFRALMADYLAEWGERCPEELKLDRPTFREDPAPLYATLRSLVARVAPTGQPDAHGLAEAEVARRLHAAGPLVGGVRRVLFALVLQRTRYHVRCREQMRFARGRVYGIGRRVFAAVGCHLAAAGLLDAAGDVHYLGVEEILAALRGTGPSDDLAFLARQRRTAYAVYASAPPLPSRLESIGPVALRRWRAVAAPRDRATGPLVGSGACAGRVSAPCLVVRDPRQAGSVAGCILVAESTDPGWVPLMAAAAGLLVERGGLLSHSAIVARELGLPTIVGIAGLMERVVSGQRLSMDGATGRVEPEAAHEDGRR